MPVIQATIKKFVSGVQNLLDNEDIPIDAASDELSWITIDGKIVLAYGRQPIGDYGGVGKSYMEHTAFKANGTAVRFRKVNGAIQTLVGSTWVDVITGLTETADYVASNYASLAGAFVFFFGPDGIYKVATANPTSYASLYDSTKNFKGYGIIDKGRTLLWGRADDPTGLYGSYIDAQNASVYTTVAGEATASLAGTLAFKAGGATRNAFGVTITLTVGGEVFTDNFNGVLVGNQGHTGTINYMTGAYTLSVAGTGTVNYQYEDSNAKGVTDFTHSATRLAGEGFMLRQDFGGDAIVVVIAYGGAYFSLKKRSCYKLVLDSTDLAPDNNIFRTDIGISSLRAACGSSLGIVFMNTANQSKPRLERLEQNNLGDSFKTKPLFSRFAFENYDHTDDLLETWDKYLIVSCKTLGNLENNRLLLCNMQNGTVDITYYGIRTATKLDSFLYGGDSVSKTTYELFTGFDDNGLPLTNFWDGSGYTLGNSDSRSGTVRSVENTLKKFKKLRIKGVIDPAQEVEVYVSYDDGDFQLVGTILGTGDYVNYSTSYAVGTTLVGESVVGGGGTTTSNVYGFYMEIKLKTPKFRKRMLRFVANKIGYVAIESTTDWDYWLYQDKIPASYRSKQNVALAGAPTDLPNPQF